MHITLISPRIALQKRDFLGSGVPYWPVDLAVFAAFLKQKGNEVSVIDLFGSALTTLEDRGDHYLQGKPFDHFVETAAVKDGEIFILYAISYMSHGELLSIARLLRRCRPDAAVSVLENSQAVTSYAVSNVAEDFFKNGVTSLLCGEVYWNWDEVCSYLRNPREVSVPENVLGTEGPAGHVFNRKILKYPTYPLPAWEMFPLENYWALPYSHGPKTKRFLPILTSRGCPYPCDFCVVPEINRTQWRGRGPEEVVKEMIILRDKFGVRDFQIEDLNPTVHAGRWEKICELLVERKAGINFYFVSGTKVETIKVDKVPLYARAGCRYISISPESGSRKLLKVMGKPFNYDHGIAVIQACRKNGIYTQACFLVGHPEETPEDHQLSCKYLASLARAGLDEVAVFVIAPLPGSRLHSESRIELRSADSLLSFSPKGREGYKLAARRRRQLIWVFFVAKVRSGFGIWLQGMRSLLGLPRTKMENLPRRVAFVYWLIFKYRLKRVLAGIF